jgi:hypothetical protein
MERRNFIKSTLLASGGFLLLKELKAHEVFNTFKGSAKIYEDGSFDLIFDKISLKNCYPALDDINIHPLSVIIKNTPTGKMIRYTLKKGTLKIIIDDRSDNLSISTELEGIDYAPLIISPIANASIEGCARFFKQGLGFGGPSGVFELKKSIPFHDQNNISEQSWSYDSYLCSAMISPDESTVSFGAYDHQNYLQRTTFSNLVHRQGLVDYKVAQGEKFILNIGFLTENIPLTNKKLTLPAVYFISSSKPFDAMTALAGNISKANNVKLKEEPLTYWDSWYEYYEDFSSRNLDDFLEGVKTVNPKPPFDVVYISAGYCPLGDWLIADKTIYPNGLEAEAKKIIASGKKLGLYMGPFMVSDKSVLYKEHPDWVLKDKNNEPIIDSIGAKGMIDNLVVNEKRMYLDSSHPEAFDYIRKVIETYKKWGTSVYFIDFLDWGFKISSEVKRHTPGKTSVQYFRDVIKMIRETAGNDAWIIGCIAPFAPIIGLVDVCRVAYDSTQSWDGNIINMLQETEVGQYFNNVYWHNDPDVLTLRHSSTVALKDHEIKTLAYWAGMLGGVISTSDRFHKIQPYRLKLWRFVASRDKYITGKFPFWCSNKKKFKYILKPLSSNSFALLIANIDKNKNEESLSIFEILPQNNYRLYDWSPGKFEKIPSGTTITSSLEPHDSRLIFITSGTEEPNPKISLGGILTEGLDL